VSSMPGRGTTVEVTVPMPGRELSWRRRAGIWGRASA
jgi:hypothetical protein